MAKLFRKSKSERTIVARRLRSVAPMHEVTDAKETAQVLALEAALDCLSLESSTTRRDKPSRKLRSPVFVQREIDLRSRRTSQHRLNKPIKSSLRTPGASSCSSSCASASTTDSSIGFRNVEIREFAPAIGDSPTVQAGPPISLSWTLTKHDTVDFEQFEKIRDGRRRRGKELEIGASERRELLLSSGFSPNEIHKAEVASYSVYMQRIATLQNDRRKKLIKKALGFRDARDYGTL